MSPDYKTGFVPKTLLFYMTQFHFEVICLKKKIKHYCENEELQH